MAIKIAPGYMTCNNFSKMIMQMSQTMCECLWIKLYKTCKISKLFGFSLVWVTKANTKVPKQFQSSSTPQLLLFNTAQSYGSVINCKTVISMDKSSNLNPTRKRRAGAQVTLPRVAKEKTAFEVIVICNCELYKLVSILVFPS